MIIPPATPVAELAQPWGCELELPDGSIWRVTPGGAYLVRLPTRHNVAEVRAAIQARGDGEAAAYALPPEPERAEPAPVARQWRPTPTRDAARARAVELLGGVEVEVEGDPLDAWLIANQDRPVVDQARDLGVERPGTVRGWREDLRQAGRLSAYAPAKRYDVCPNEGCGRKKVASSTQCGRCAERDRQQAAARSLRDSGRQRATVERPRYYAPGGPPLSDASARALALCQAAQAAGDAYEVAYYHRRYWAARARDWGLVVEQAPKRRQRRQQLEQEAA